VSALDYSKLAEADIDEIWDYSAERWSVEQADAYVDQLHNIAERIARNPAIGRDGSSIRPGLFRYPAMSHMIYFRKRSSGIIIVRVLHQSMDASRYV
jgi:toxin ParE1/3/4